MTDRTSDFDGSDETEQLRAAAADPESASPDHIIEQFRCGDTEDQTAALEAVVAVTEVAPATATEAVSDLLEHLDADVPRHRIAAARALATIAEHDPDAVLPHLGELRAGLSLNDELLTEELVVAFVAILSESPDAADAATMNRLASLLESDLPTTRQLVTEVFVSLSERRPDVVIPVVDSLVTFLATTDSLAEDSLPVPEDPVVAEAAHVLDERENIREVVIRKQLASVLGAVAATAPEAVVEELLPVVSDLVAVVDDADPHVRETAVGLCSFLAEYHPHRLQHATETFLEQLEDDRRAVRAGAAWTLCYLDAEAAVEPLSELQHSDPEQEVRAVAAEALDQIGSAGSRPESAAAPVDNGPDDQIE